MKKVVFYALLFSLLFNLNCFALQDKKAIKKEIKKYEKNISNNINDKAENFYRLGELNYKIDKNKKAEFYFLASTLLNPKNDKAYIYLGDIALFENENYQEAFLNYTKAIKTNPNNAEGYYCRSLVYYYMYDFDNAFKDINKALEMDKNNEFYINRRNKILESKIYYYSAVI